VGLSVHAAARICFAAHGGQILLSAAVRAALQPLPEEVSLRGLGAWRYRGLPEPIELFQAEAPELPVDFPVLRSALPAE
jgi:class 3 adenylate cyclase